jgi:hypothetical protein
MGFFRFYNSFFVCLSSLLGVVIFNNTHGEMIMRRSASEILRDLEKRVATLEYRDSKLEVYVQVEFDDQDGSRPFIDKRTFRNIEDLVGFLKSSHPDNGKYDELVDNRNKEVKSISALRVGKLVQLLTVTEDETVTASILIVKANNLDLVQLGRALFDDLYDKYKS